MKDAETTLVTRIRERLDATGKTARGASREAGLSPDALRLILGGRSQSPRSANLSAIARVLGCDVRYLLGETQEAGSATEIDDSPGSRLRSARRNAGWSTEQLAEHVGRSPSAVRNQENGTNGIPADLASLYADALGVTPESILFGGRSGAPSPAEGVGVQLLGMPNGKARLTVNKTLPMSVALQVLALIEGAET